MFIFLCWIGLSFLAGYIGSDRKIGFWGGFLLSIFLSPFESFPYLVSNKTKEFQS
jgi:hypothetical protein